MRRIIAKYKHRCRMLWRLAIWRGMLPCVYRLGCLRRIDPKRIFFVHDHEDTPGDNFVPIIQQLQQQGYTCEFHGRVRGVGGRLRQYLMLMRFAWQYPRARAVFLMEVTNRIDRIRPRNGTQIVQLWHGCGAFKQWGYSTIDLKWGVSARTYKFFPANRFYTYTSVSSPEVIRHYAQAFNNDPATIHPWGVPRTDFFFQPGIVEQCRAQVLAALPEIGTRKIVLYAPTFRGNSLRKSRHDDVLDYDMMDTALGSDCALLLKPHPRARKSIPEPLGETPFVFNAADMPIHVLLCAADLVITDYSSLIFEYSLLERPMLFYAYDLDNYDKTRSFYYPYLDFVPGDVVWDTEDIITGIEKNLLHGKFNAAQVQAFAEKFMCACDGNSTMRIIEKVLGE